MREEIEELVFHMADLKDRIAQAKHPTQLKKEYDAHKAHVLKLYDIQDMILELEASKKYPITTSYADPAKPTQDEEIEL